MTLNTDQIKKLVDKYPFLIPHNSWTEKVVEDYDYTYTEAWPLPEGWQRLFYLLCKSLKPHIEKANLLDKFYFTEVKEKYGTMRVYTSCLPDSVGHLIDIYECYSKYVCQNCGRDAKYCTTGWISHLCERCVSDKELTTLVKHKNIATFECFTKNEGNYRLQYSYRPIKKQYHMIMNMSDEAFVRYLLAD